MPGDEPERLPLPPPRVLEQIRTHLADKHGVGTPRAADAVYRGGPWQEGQHISWDPGKGAFHCHVCEVTHATGEITPEMVERALLFSDDLKPHLAGLTADDDRAEMARHFLRGDLNRERLRQLRGADARRRAAKGARPTVEARRAKLQPWLLERVREIGVLKLVLDEAEAMQHDDPTAWSQLCDQKPSRDTMTDWWQDIDPAVRAEAFATDKQRAKKST